MHNSDSQLQKLFNQNKPLILDGAMGSLIQQKGFVPDNDLWMTNINLDMPTVIQDIHTDYINAGCDIITSNTFRTNPIALKKANYDIDNEFTVSESIKLSKVISDKFDVLLAASNAPAQDCYQSERTISKNDLEYNHSKHIELLYNSGSDFILNETQSNMDEIELICKYCNNNDIPFIISLFVTDDNNILSGESIEEVITLVKSYSPLLISFNCVYNRVLETIIASIKMDFNWGFYLNCGSGNFTDKNIECGINAEDYANISSKYLIHKPSLIGSCCGSTPNHIKSIKELLNEKTNT